jgi:hypothetical protein
MNDKRPAERHERHGILELTPVVSSAKRYQIQGISRILRLPARKPTHGDQIMTSTVLRSMFFWMELAGELIKMCCLIDV